MPTSAVVAMITLFGVLASAAVGSIVAERRLRLERGLDRALRRLIDDLLLIPETPARRFSTIAKHLKGVAEDDIRKALIQAGAVCFETDDGEEVWGMAGRLKASMVPKEERPFSLVVEMFSTTAQCHSDRMAVLLASIDKEGADFSGYAAARDDFLEFAELSLERFSILAERPFPRLSVEPTGAIKAVWHERTDGQDELVCASFIGSNTVKYTFCLRAGTQDIRNCVGVDTVAGFQRLMPLLVPLR